MDACSFETMRCDAATADVRRTRMGQLTFSDRPGVERGSLTETMVVNGRTWAGSEYTAFAMTRGTVTGTHVDGQMVNGEHVLLPAAGVLQSVNRGPHGNAKTAVVVCAPDMDRVVEVLGLVITNPSATQYTGAKLGIGGLIEILNKNGIRFSVVGFPQRCSYAIPRGCAHLFVTDDELVETVAWHPSLKTWR